MRHWTDEDREVVAGFLKDGLSASQIGRRMGVTRNAIIGLVGRSHMLSSIGFTNKRGSPRPDKRSLGSDHVEMVRGMLKDGWSLENIAAHHGCAQSSVGRFIAREPTLAAFRRMTLAKPRKPSAPRERAPKRVKAPKPLVFRQPVQRAPEPPRPEPERPVFLAVPISELRPRQCKFAVNNAARGETHLFCGAQAEGSFCDYHKRIVYQPAAERVRYDKRIAA